MPRGTTGRHPFREISSRPRQRPGRRPSVPSGTARPGTAALASRVAGAPDRARGPGDAAGHGRQRAVLRRTRHRWNGHPRRPRRGRVRSRRRPVSAAPMQGEAPPLVGVVEHPADDHVGFGVAPSSGWAVELPWIWLPRSISPDYHDQVVACCLAADFAPEARHTARSITSQLAMVACGLGVAIVPESAATWLDSCGVAPRGESPRRGLRPERPLGGCRSGCPGCMSAVRPSPTPRPEDGPRRGQHASSPGSAGHLARQDDSGSTGTAVGGLHGYSRGRSPVARRPSSPPRRTGPPDAPESRVCGRLRRPHHRPPRGPACPSACGSTELPLGTEKSPHGR
jgi:hypothetical protein